MDNKRFSMIQNSTIKSKITRSDPFLKIFVLIFLLFFVSNVTALEFYDRLEEYRQDMQSSLKIFIDSLVDKRFDEEALDKYIESSAEYTRLSLNKPYFYIDKTYEIDFLPVHMMFLSDGRLLVADDKNFAIYSFSEDSLKLDYKSPDINGISFINILDIDMDGSDEIFILAEGYQIYYIVKANRIMFGWKEKDDYNMRSLYRVQMNSKTSRIMTIINEIDNEVYETYKGQLHYINWLYPGYDLKKIIVDDTFNERKMSFEDIDYDGDTDIFYLYEHHGKINGRWYENNNFNDFYKRDTFEVSVSGMRDYDIDGENLYILTIDGIWRYSFDRTDLIKDGKFFNIEGSSAFAISPKKKIFVSTLGRKIHTLAKMQ